MPWSNSRPRSARYGQAHRTEREQAMAALCHAGHGTCAETRNPGSRCLEPSPLITPDMELHLCHNSATGQVLGLGHARCNRGEAARRARAKQDGRSTMQSPLRW